MAVRLAAGLPQPKAKRVNLSALRRKDRGGRKQGRKRRLDPTELCTPDSDSAPYLIFIDDVTVTSSS